MAVQRIFFSVLFLFFMTTAASFAADGVSPYAYKLFEGLPITNSMITSLVVSLIIIVAVRTMTGAAKLQPTRGQSVIEGLVEGTMGMMEPIVGKKMVKPTFPIIISLFFFILIHNWSGLMPSVAAFGHYDEAGHLLYYYRPANSDLNNTIALAVVAMGAWLFLCIKHAGFGVLIADLFGNKADKKSTAAPIYAGLTVVFLLVGIIEVVSICIRPVSLSLRLFGNIFGGESLLDKMLTLTPWFVPVAFPFYMFELMVGFVQALVFCLLVSVYVGLICNHEGGDHH